MLDWDAILITVLHDDGVIVRDEYSYSLDAEQRIITFAGNKGDKGDPGEAATIQIGTVTTLPAGSSATVENVGTPSDARFNFGIPQGQKGDPGDPGSDTWGDITGTLSDQTDLQNALNAKEDALTFDSTPTDGSSNPVTSDGIYDALAGKQDELTFDTAPTASSTNPVTSGGIKTALNAKQDSLTFDNTPTASSSNPVTSGGIKIALDGKQNTLTFDSTPTTNSSNPVISSGIKTYVDNRILRFYNQSTSVTTSSTAEFCKVQDSRINANTVVLECTFTEPGKINSLPTWSNGTGYISLKGICTSSTCKVNLVLGQKGN